MAKTKKKLSKRIIALIVCAAFIVFLALVAFGLQIAFWVSDASIKCIQPDYPMLENLEEYLEGELDYDLLYRQTGLTQVGIDRALEKGEAGKKLIKRIQADFFEPHEVKNDHVAPYACTDYIEKHVENIYLKEGDVIVTSSTHISFVRIGHAGLVTGNGANAPVLQANAYGTYSRIGNIGAFTDRVNFMVLQPKPEMIDDDTRHKVVEYAKTSLLNIPYEGLAGLVTNKNDIKKSQCAHIVWYAYKHCGIDLDSNGGCMVVPYDLAHSEYLQPVQVFGFDLDELWK